MSLWPARTRSAQKTSKQKKSVRRFGFDRPQCEWLEPRLLLAADLSITKAQVAPLSGGLPADVTAGEMISYQITVANSNAATSAATNTTLTDVLPAGESLISASAAGGTLSVSGNTITENLGTINAGSAATVTIDALVTGQVSGTLSNTASVTTPDENSGLPIVSAPVSTKVTALGMSPANLSISKTAANNDAAVSVGAAETYTIIVSNSVNTANNVTVLDSLPAGATFISGTLTGGTGPANLAAPTGNLETVDVGTLNANGNATISLTIDAPNAVGAMVNTATVTTTSGNTNAVGATAQVATAVQGTSAPVTGVNLSVTKTAPVSGSVNASETDTIVVANNGTANATGVVVSDELPPQALFISGSSSVSGVNVTNSNGLVSATLPTLAAGASATLTITLTPTITGTLTDTAYVESDQPDGDQANNSASATVLVGGIASPAVDLSVTKTASTASLTANSDETYTIVVKNNSANLATGVVVSDAIPANATFVSATDSLNATLSPVNNAIIDRLGTLAANASATLTVTLKAGSIGVVTDTASVTSDQLDTNLANNIAAVSTPVQGTAAPSVDLSITKTAANNNADVALGSNETYTIVVTNNGMDTANGVVVTDVLPATATFVSATTSAVGATVTNSSGAVNVSLGSLAAGSSDTVTLTLTPTVAGAITDTAYVESNNSDVNEGNNSASVTSTVVSAAQQANVSILKVATPNPATVGQNLTYTLVVTNTGAAAAADVDVSDMLPADVTFVSASTDVSGVSATDINGTVTANLGNVAAGTIDTITIVVTPTVAGTVNNTATVSTSTANASAHTSATTATTVNAAPPAQTDLSIFKFATPNPGTVGQNETYVLVVVNTGSVAADDVDVTDSLPSGITYVSGSTDVNGVSVVKNNDSVTAHLGSVAPGAVDTVTIIVTPNQAGTLQNSASVSTSTPNASTHMTATTDTVINGPGQANVSITKAAPATGTVGTNLTYTITVTNAAGAAAAAGVVITDTLPAGVTFVSGTDSSGGALTNSADTVTDTLSTSLAAGATDTVTIVVTPGAATAGTTITNTAKVATTTTNIGTPTTASANTAISIATQANLSITKTASPSPGTVGQNLTYTIVVSDAAGAANADGVVVTDNLPTSGIGTQVTAKDVTRNVTLTENNGAITDSINSLAAGTSDTITITVTPTQTGTLTNTASVTTTTTNSNANTTATAQTTINPTSAQANLSISKTATPSPATVGQPLTYTIVVTDAAGAADAAGVMVTDNLPTSGIGAQITAKDTTRNVTLTASNGVITDNIQTLSAGTSDTITVTVTPTQPGTLTNTANVTTTTSNMGAPTSVTVNTTVNPVSTGHSCYLNGQPGDGTNQTFITNLYRELLGREPDSQSFQAWVNLLQSNAANAAAERQTVIQAFLHSQEYEAHWVDCVYDEFLGRHADEGGEKGAVKALNNGATMQDVLISILSSPEYLAHNGHTNTSFVQALYQQLLGRPVDQASQQALVGALDNGQFTRGQAVEFILTSPEEAHDMLNAPGSAPGAPGTPATGSYPLAVVTGGGWDNLYFQGDLGTLNSSAVDQVMSELESGTSWQTVEQNMLTLPQYFNAV